MPHPTGSAQVALPRILTDTYFLDHSSHTQPLICHMARRQDDKNIFCSIIHYSWSSKIETRILRLPAHANILAFIMTLETAITKVLCGWLFQSIIPTPITASFEYTTGCSRQSPTNTLICECLWVSSASPPALSICVWEHTYTLHILAGVYDCMYMQSICDLLLCRS